MWSYAPILSIIIAGLAKAVLAQAQCTPIYPSPSDVICNERGYWTDRSEDSYDAYQTVTDIETCQKFLLDEESRTFHYLEYNPKSLGDSIFSFNTSSNLCTLYNVEKGASGNQFVANASSDTIFYDQRCFRCPKPCPLLPNTNIVDNPGFELSSQYIGPWVGNGIEVVSPGYNSSNAVLLQNGTPLNKITQTLTLCKSQTYMYSYDLKKVRSKGTTDDANVIFEMHIGELLLSRELVPSSNSEETGWQTSQGSFRLDDDDLKSDVQETEMSFYLGNTPANYYLDNIAVWVLSAAPATEGSNLIENPGFETGTLVSWTQGDFYNNISPDGVEQAIVSPGISGTYSFQATFNKSKSYTPGGFKSELSQNFTVTPYTTYLLSFDYFVRHAGMILYLYVGVPHSNDSWFQFVPVKNEITTRQVVFQTTSETQSRINVEGHSGLVTGYPTHNSLLLDNFQIEELAQ